MRGGVKFRGYSRHIGRRMAAPQWHGGQFNARHTPDCRLLLVALQLSSLLQFPVIDRSLRWRQIYAIFSLSSMSNCVPTRSPGSVDKMQTDQQKEHGVVAYDVNLRP